VSEPVPDRVPRLPRDPQDDPRNRKRDQWVAHIEAEGDDGGAEHDTETDERIYAGMVAVRDKRRAIESASLPRSHLSGHEVTPKAHQPREGEGVQVVRRLRVDQTDHGLVGSDTGRNEDRAHDRKTGVSLRPRGTKQEGDRKRYGGERVADVVNQVSEKSNAAAKYEDRALGGCSKGQDEERFRDGAEPLARPPNGWIYESVGVVMQARQPKAAVRGEGPVRARPRAKLSCPRQRV
jgi:hypothetical protein